MISGAARAICCHLQQHALRRVNYVAVRRKWLNPRDWVNDRRYEINSIAVVLVRGSEILVYTWQEDFCNQSYRYMVDRQFDLNAPDSLDSLTRYCRRFRFESFMIRMLAMVFPSNWLYDPSLTVVDYGE